MPLLQRKRLAANDARKLLLQIKTTLKTMTIAKVVKNQGFLFEKIIGTGNGNSLVYRVLQLSTGAVLCGKVYGDLVFNNLNAHAEVKTIAQLHGDDPHPNTAKIYETIEFSHESTPSEPGLVALIFPYYPMSLSDIMQAFGQTIFPYNLFLSLARGLLSAGTRFQEKNFAHCDLKPQNVMMDNFVPVVIDFGAVTELGFPLREHTPFYSLDANEEKVSPHYDLFCIVVILARCFLPSLDLEERSRVGFMGEINDYVSRDKELEKYGKLCIDLLNCQSSKEGLTCLP